MAGEGTGAHTFHHADRSPVRSRSSSTGRRRYATLHVSSALHIHIIHLAFPAFHSRPLHPPFPAALTNIHLNIKPSVPFLRVLTFYGFSLPSTFTQGASGQV